MGQAYEEITVAGKEGEDHETAYQARYLTEALRAMDTEEMVIGLGEGLKQGSMSQWVTKITCTS